MSITHKPFIVTINLPLFVSVSAPDEEMAKGIAADYWAEQRVFEMIENATDRTDWYIADADLFDSDHADVSVEES